MWHASCNEVKLAIPKGVCRSAPPGLCHRRCQLLCNLITRWSPVSSDRAVCHPTMATVGRARVHEAHMQALHQTPRQPCVHRPCPSDWLWQSSCCRCNGLPSKAESVACKHLRLQGTVRALSCRAHAHSRIASQHFSSLQPQRAQGRHSSWCGAESSNPMRPPLRLCAH